jgi:HSP20 family protein
MARYTWDPFEELRRMQSRMSRIFGETPETLLPEQQMPEVQVPFVDVIEKGNDIIVTADMPGVDKNDIKINVRDNMLEISAERKSEQEQKGKEFYRHERSFSRFYREIRLPAAVDQSKAKATFNNGVLEVTLPMTAKEKESTIPVQ